MTETRTNVTIKDVARSVRLAHDRVPGSSTSSLRVSPVTRSRVEQAIAELGYVPSSLARGLSRQKTGTIALIVPDVANPFFTLIVRGAEDVARRAGYRVLLCDTRFRPDARGRGDRGDDRDRVEGIVIAPVSDARHEASERLARFGVPFVLIDRTIPGVERDVVLGDSTAGAARSLVEHLTALGHRRIGTIVEDENVSTARERRAGYVEALGHAGIELDPALVVQAGSGPPRWRCRDGEAARARRAAHRVFTVNNLVALGAIEAARGRHRAPRRRCPCYDDIGVRVAALPVPTRAAPQPAETFGTLGTQLAPRADRRPPARPHQEGAAS